MMVFFSRLGSGYKSAVSDVVQMIRWVCHFSGTVMVV